MQLPPIELDSISLLELSLMYTISFNSFAVHWVCQVVRHTYCTACYEWDSQYPTHRSRLFSPFIVPRFPMFPSQRVTLHHRHPFLWFNLALCNIPMKNGLLFITRRIFGPCVPNRVEVSWLDTMSMTLEIFLMLFSLSFWAVKIHWMQLFFSTREISKREITQSKFPCQFWYIK